MRVIRVERCDTYRHACSTLADNFKKSTKSFVVDKTIFNNKKKRQQKKFSMSLYFKTQQHNLNKKP